MNALAHYQHTPFRDIREKDWAELLLLAEEWRERAETASRDRRELRRLVDSLSVLRTWHPASAEATREFVLGEVESVFPRTTA